MQITHGSDVNGEIHDLNKKLHRFLNRSTQDVIATTLLLLVLPFGVLLHLFYVLPTWYSVMSGEWINRAIMIGFFSFNLYSNWYMMIRVGPNGMNAILPNIVTAGFRYCHDCRANAAPRSHHCPVCDTCVLRRDHHCSFGGVCIGHFNQRYFVAAVINLFCMLLPLVSYGWDLLNEILPGGVTWHKYWQIMIPHVAFIARFMSFYQFCHVLIFVFTFTSFAFALYLLVAQFFCIYKGQTRIEFLMDVHAYQLGLMENIRQTLGTRWFLIGVSSFIPSPLPSNGLHFVTREIHAAHTKDL